MNRNQRNFNHRGNRGGDRDGGMNFNRKGLLGEPPGMGGMNGPQMGGGLGILGSAPGQGMPGGNMSGPLGGMNQNNMFGGMGGGMGQQMGMAQGRGGMDQSHNQNDMNRGGQGGMNQGNQGMMGMQQQMAAAAMRDSQLQLVSNLIQQQGGMSSPMMGGPNQGGMMTGGQGMGGGGASLLGMGGMGMNEMGRNNERRNSGGNNIPSLFDINTKKTGLLGKRGNMNNRDRESRFSNHQNNNKRMRQNNQGQSPRGFHQNRQGQQYRQSRWSDRSPTRAGGARPREREFRRPSSRDSKYSDRSPNSRTSRDRRESGSSSRKDESEEYDPAQPTEEDDELDVPPLESDPEDVLIPEVTVQVNNDDKLTKDEDADESMEEEAKSPCLAEGGDSSLTITLSGSGRSVNDGNTEKTETESSPTKKSSNYCHACGVECRTEEGFAKHMNGKKHKVRMESLLTLHQEKSKQFEARIKAEEHLRKIEGKPRHERRSSGGDGSRYHNVSGGRYSRDNFGNTPPSGHFRHPGPTHMTPSGQRRGNQGHSGGAWLRKTSRYELWPRCNVCSQMFKSPEKFIRHLKTPHHLENLRDRARKSSREDDEDSGFPDFGDMVTVDTIGFEDDYLSQENSDDEQESTEQDQTKCPEKETAADIDPSKQEYNPEIAVGQKFIVPVSGFFCKLCHRFYNSETAAKVSHCQSEPHFKNFQKAMLTKQLIKKNKRANTSDPAAQTANEEGESQSDNQLKPDVKDETEGQNDKLNTTQSNGDISSTDQSVDLSLKIKTETDVSDIDPETEVKLLERSSESGSPEVPDDEDSLLEEEEEEEEMETEEVKPVNTKLSPRGRGEARGRARRGRRGKN